MKIELIEGIKQLDYENEEVIKCLAESYKKWLELNRYYDFEFIVIDLYNKFNTCDVIIIHNLWKENGKGEYNISDGEEFIDDIAYLLYNYIECRDFDEDEMEYLNNFWNKKVEYLTSL